MNGRRWSVLSSKGQLSTARLLPRASICVWSAVWVGSSAESAMANLEPNRSGSANNVSMTSSWHTYSSSHNFVRPPSPAPILTGQAKLTRRGLRLIRGVKLQTRRNQIVQMNHPDCFAAITDDRQNRSRFLSIPHDFQRPCSLFAGKNDRGFCVHDIRDA